MPDTVDVCIEIRRGGFVKWGADGGVDFVSPAPCPFNYGSVPAVAGADGDPLDAVVLGPGLRRGATVTCRVLGVVAFLDDGDRDDKLVCVPVGSPAVVRPRDARALRAFFTVYARTKASWHRLRGARGPTRFEGLRR
ncbi:MAG: inorganic diphosphatase [Alphaproteobacteria bacterium]|nr:inorganic diphosphatase [Alphaproteobacteria bacterium]